MIDKATVIPQNKELFLLEEVKEFNIDVPFQKVLGFSPMFNNTCVVLAIKSNRIECVSHIDSTGTVLKQLEFYDSNFFPYVITSDREIVWLDVDRDMILQWNLETYEFLELPFAYRHDPVDGYEVYVYPDTKLICVAEWGKHDCNIYRLTYFQYPLRPNPNQQQSGAVYTTEEDDSSYWNYEYNMKRGNTHSMMLWYKPVMKKEIEIKTFSLKFQGKWEGEYRQYRIQNPLRNNAIFTELSVANIWEMTPGKFCLVALSDLPTKEDEYPNSIFVYETENAVFRRANFQLQGKFKFQMIDQYAFGSTSMIRTFDFEKGVAQRTPIYFIDNQNECIAARSTWVCTHLNKYTMPAYDRDLIIDAEYENDQVKHIVSRSIKAVNPREIIANMVAQLIPDVDEDLVHEIVEMTYIRRR